MFTRNLNLKVRTFDWLLLVINSVPKRGIGMSPTNLNLTTKYKTG